ncbi:MAG: MFS transporter [Zoogloea sp.]|uniref:MFS transporter n=1 Tax=Zoogloea sp. TaxID=49181 RepID=UPI003F30BCF2
MSDRPARSALAAALFRRAPALSEANFRRYFYGQIVSVIGTFIQAVALSWLVYRLTDSPALLGLTAFLSQAPQLLVAPFAGVLIDRVDRRHLLLLIQSAFAVQASLLALLSYFDLVQVWHLLLLAAAMGILNSFDLPTRQSLLLYLVEDRSALTNAVALNAAVVHSGRLIGPPIAGLLLSLLPESLCFLLNALSYLGPIYAVLAIRARIPRQQGLRTGKALREVLAFFRQSREARAALLAVGLVNFTASTYVVLMPVFAREVFGGSPRALGILLGMGGAGALCASLYLSSRAHREIPPKLLLHSVALAVGGMAGFTLAGWLGWFYLGLPMVMLIGAGIGATNVAGNTRLQYLSPEGLRGRVISIFGSTRFGLDALGGLIAGALAAWLGAVSVEGLLVLLLGLGGGLIRDRFFRPPVAGAGGRGDH